MELTLTLTGNIEEVTMAVNAIEKANARQVSLFDTLSKPLPVPLVTDIKLKKKPIGHGRASKIDILMGSRESGFAHYKTFATMDATAKHLGLKEAANIAYYVKNDRVYKGIYKFIKHSGA